MLATRKLDTKASRVQSTIAGVQKYRMLAESVALHLLAASTDIKGEKPRKALLQLQGEAAFHMDPEVERAN